MNKIKKIALFGLSFLTLGSSMVNNTAQSYVNANNAVTNIKMANQDASLYAEPAKEWVYQQVSLYTASSQFINIDSTGIITSGSSTGGVYDSKLKRIDLNSSSKQYRFSYCSVYLLRSSDYSRGSYGEIRFKTLPLNPSFNATASGVVKSYDDLRGYDQILIYNYNGSARVEQYIQINKVVNAKTEVTYNQTENKSQEDIINSLNLDTIFGFHIRSKTVHSTNYVPGKYGQFTIVLDCIDDFGTNHSLSVSVIITKNNLVDNTFELYVDVDDQVSEDQIKTLFKAEDIFGTAVELVQTESNYKANTIGDYTIKYTATDQWENTATLTVTVHVISVVPTITPKDDIDPELIKVAYSDYVTQDFIESMFEYREADGSVISNPEITWDKDFSNEKIGKTTYILSVKSKQNPLKSGKLTITIEVNQDIPPLFFVSNDIAYTSSKTPLKGSDFKAIVAYIRGVNVNSITNFNVTNIHDYEQAFKDQSDNKYTIKYAYTDSSTSEKVSGDLTLVHSNVDGMDSSNNIFDYFNDALMRDGFKWENFGDYLLYFICFGWIWMPLVNWEV